jgi:hypothetical protein
VRRGGLQQAEQLRLEAEQVLVRVVAARPAAGRRERHDRLRPAARRELERDEAAERVAGEVRRLEAGLVHRALDRVGEQGVADLAHDRRAARVPGQRQGEDFVTALQRRQDELPGAPGVDEAVEADQRRPGAAAVRGREGRVRRG